MANGTQTPTVDYEALAQQARGASSSSSGTVDYEALANQARSTSAGNFQMKGAKGSKGGPIVTIPPTGSIPVPPSTDPTSAVRRIDVRAQGCRRGARRGAGTSEQLHGAPESTTPISDINSSVKQSLTTPTGLAKTAASAVVP